MRQEKNNIFFNLDWFSILLYFLLVGFGWINIYASSSTNTSYEIFDFTTNYGKQLLWIGLSIPLIIFILFLNGKFIERFASILYVCSLLLLAGVLVFGKKINGATSWYNFGGVGLQPSEFTKAFTALAVAKLLSDRQYSLKLVKNQVKAFIVIFFPAFLIALQPDMGSVLIYFAFFFVLSREGLTLNYITFGILAIFLFISTIYTGHILMLTLSFSIITLYLLVVLLIVTKKKVNVATLAFLIIILLIGAIYATYIQMIILPLYSISFFLFVILCLLTALIFSYIKNKNKEYIRVNVFKYFAIYLITGGYILLSSFAYTSILSTHQKDRFDVLLGIKTDNQGIGYNTYQSELTISSGNFLGKGFLQGDRTQGDFVPEQHTDYIFSTIGEEWGFIGSSSVIIIFMALLYRIIILSENTTNKFGRIYGYGVASIIFFHITVNIGMVIGLLPTVGIPLPFFSYGGSSLWGFTLLLFIFIRLDAHKTYEL